MRGGGPGTAGVQGGDVKNNGNGNGNASPEARVVGGLAEFANDFATLAELQAKLTALDAEECVARIKWPLAAIGAGVVFILGALPVALLGLAQVLAAALHIGIGWATLLTAGVVLLASAAVIALSLRGFATSFSCFRRSREELIRNLNWIRTVLLYSGRSLPRRIR
jgi:hypothetical protein